jgi:hypothetical protein
MVAYEKMTVVQLKERLTKRGLPKTGNKADLIARLRSKKSPAKKAPAKKTPTKKTPTKKTPTKKTPTKKTPTKKTTRKLSASSKWSCSMKKKSPGKKGAKIRRTKCPEFVFTYESLPNDRKKVVKQVMFPVGEGGTNPYHTLKFTTAKTEAEALKAITKFMNVKIDKEWAEMIGEDFEELQEIEHYCNRGDLLQDHRIFEGSDIKGSKMFVEFGS